MARKSAFQAFLKEFQIDAKEPASEAQFQMVESKLGFALSKSLRSYYLICDGGQAKQGPEGPRSALELLSLKAALNYASVPGFFDSYWSYFPYAQNNDSNLVCVCCKSPLADYVVLVMHDDAPRLMFRSLESFFRSAMEYVKNGEFLDTHELTSEFAGPDRNKKDLSIARRLIELGRGEDGLSDLERIDALRFACDLLSDENVDEIGGLLKIENEYVREHAANRLKRIPGTKSRKALNQFEGDFDSFVERCAQKLQRENIQASVQAAYGKKTIRIDPGPIWLNMEMLYSKRQQPDFDSYLLERARFFLAHEKKRNNKRGG